MATKLRPPAPPARLVERTRLDATLDDALDRHVPLVLASAPAGITTTAANTATPASPTAIDVSTVGTAVTLTETAISGYALASASCTDANSAVTGNSGSIGTVSGTTLTIPAANVVAGELQVAGQVVHLHLDATHLREVAVGHEADLQVVGGGTAQG